MADSAHLDIRHFLPHSQTLQHFNEVHAAGAQSGVVTNTKGNEAATPVEEHKLSRYDPEYFKVFHPNGELINQHRNASDNPNVKVRNCLRAVGC